MLAPMRRRTRVLLGLGGVLLLLAGAAALYLGPRWDALRCLLAFTEDVPPDGTCPEGFERVRDASRLGVDDAWIARPSGGGRRPLLVFVAGIAPNGLEDGRIVRAVDAFRRGGFVVVAPEVKGLVDPGGTDMDEGGLGRLLDRLAAGAVPDADATHTGVVAISVGAGYALRVLASRAAAGLGVPRAFLAVGAPADLDRCARRWFEEPPLGKPAPETDEDERRHAAELARNMLWRTAAAKIVGDAVDAATLNEWLKEKWVPEWPPEGLATDAGRAYAAMVLGPPAGWIARRDEVLAAAATWTAWLSPAGFADELAALRGLSVFLLHGEADPLVPASEMEPLARLLRAHVPVTTLESRMVSHTDVGDVGLGERFAHLDFMDAFFDTIVQDQP